MAGCMGGTFSRLDIANINAAIMECLQVPGDFDAARKVWAASSGCSDAGLYASSVEA